MKYDFLQDIAVGVVLGMSIMLLIIVLSGCSNGFKRDKLRDEFDRHQRYQEPKR